MRVILFFFILLCGCQESSPPVSRERLQGEYIQRRHDEAVFEFPPPLPRKETSWPWRKTTSGDYPRITKEFFRCKGNQFHPIKEKENSGRAPTILRDCGGNERHGLPLRDGKETIYPCLIELLNYVQEQTGHRVVITCGHRCPTHNRYSDDSKGNLASKHMLGAEVDFYVEGMQDKPQEIIALLQQFYKIQPWSAGNKEFEVFQRFDKPGLNVSTPPSTTKKFLLSIIYPMKEGILIIPIPIPT